MMSCTLDGFSVEVGAATTCLSTRGQSGLNETALLEAVVRLLEPAILDHWDDRQFDITGVIRAVCAKALRALGRNQTFDQRDFDNLQGEDLLNAVHWAAVRLAATKEAVEEAYETGWRLEVQKHGLGRYAGMRGPKQADGSRPYRYIGTLVSGKRRKR